MSKAGIYANLVVNLEGDAALTPRWFIKNLIKAMESDPLANIALPWFDLPTYGSFTQDHRKGRVGGTAAVFNKNMHALYFTKEVVPFMDIYKWPMAEELPVYHRVGVYAYRPSALAQYM